MGDSRMSDMWPEITPTQAIIREFLDKYNRSLIGTKEEANLIRLLEKANETR